MSKPRLSVTQINMLSRCSLQWWWRYGKGIKSPPGVALVLGRGTHAAVEADLVNKMEWGELLDEEEVKATAADATRRIWQEMEPVRTDEDPDEGGTVDTAVSLASLHHRQVAPALEPTAVEETFVLEMDGFPFDLTGVKDIKEKGRIRDTKTSSKTPQADEAAKSIQLTAYHLDETARGNADNEVVLDFLVKSKTPKAVSLTATRTEEDHRRFLARVEAAAKVIETGAFYPTDPGSWACSSRFCSYFDSVCPHGRAAVTVGLIDPKRLTSRVEVRRG